MSISHSAHTLSARPAAPAKERGLPSGFVLGIAIAALIWAGLGVCTTIWVSSSAMANSPVLTLTR